jgi:hypothetical protein
MNPLKIFRSYPHLVSAILATLIIIICGITILESMLALPGSVFQSGPPNIETLADDKDIAGWADFDQPSYQMGGLIRQELRVLYRHDKVIPDLDSLRRRMSFFPLEQRSVIESTRVSTNGVTEYVLEYELHAVRVEPQQTYKIDPFILYYSFTEEADDDVYSLIIQPAPIHIAAFYPQNLQAVLLQPLKGELSSAEDLRKFIMGISGILLLGLTALVLWQFGRRRPVSELTEEERLWRMFKSLEVSQLDNRTALLNYEHIFTRLLHTQSGISPEEFWAGGLPQDEDWKLLATQARELLLDNYQIPVPADAEVAKMKSLLGERLSSLVTESRLQIEQQPDFYQRIRQQPVVITQTLVLVIFALMLFALRAMPDLWLSPELKQYNTLIAALADEDINSEQIYLALSATGEKANNVNIQYPALYNAGTLRASKSFSMYTPDRENFILNAVILSDSVEELFHVLLEEGPFDEESQIVSVLIDGVEQLRRAHLDLQAAVRINPYDEDVQRNLEVVLKRRGMVLDMLSQIRRFYRTQREGEEEEALSDEGIINLLEAELPEDEEEESAGKDDRGYMILERF